MAVCGRIASVDAATDVLRGCQWRGRYHKSHFQKIPTRRHPMGPSWTIVVVSLFAMLVLVLSVCLSMVRLILVDSPLVDDLFRTWPLPSLDGRDPSICVVYSRSADLLSSGVG